MARRMTVRAPQSRDARLKTLMHRMKLAAARAVALPAPATA